MFDCLQQFNQLPKNLRDQVSSPSAMALITELEGKYKVDLAATVMKVMIKSIAIKDLAAYLESELQVLPTEAASLAQEMIAKIFPPVYEYLGLAQAKRTLDLDRDAEIIIREAGLILPSEILVSRFKNILATYLRGVRSKIDTQNTLAKDVKIGGLNLSGEEISRVFKVCSAYQFSSLTVVSRPAAAPAVPQVGEPVVPPRLSEIIAQSEQADGYDLKRALASGQLKPLSSKPEIKESAAVPQAHSQPAAIISKAQLPALSPAKNLAKAPENRLAVSAPKSLEVIKPKVGLSLFKKAATLLAGTKKAVAPVSPIQPQSAAPSFNNATKTAAVLPAIKTETLRTSPPTAEAVKPAPIAPIKKPAVSQPAVSASKSAVSSAPQSPAASRVSPPASPRPVMRDITPMPKLMGPIDELRFLDPVNFRRLGGTPGESVNKIFSKIKLLEKDGYDKMIAGVKAWRQSPVNRLYLRLGQEALAKSKPLKEIIAERKKNSQECLSEEEVAVIIALNSKLVF